MILNTGRSTNTGYYYNKYHDSYNDIVVFHLDIWNYIENLRCTAADLSQRVLKTQRNVEQIRLMINQWNHSPLFQRIDITDKKRTQPLLNLTGKSILKYYVDQ